MSDFFGQRLDQAARSALPLAVTVVFTVLGVMRWPVPYLGSIAPPLALIAVYYWAIHRPDLFRPSMAFFVGMLHDIVNGLPIGVSALLFILVHQSVYKSTFLCRAFLSHALVWFCFDGSNVRCFILEPDRHLELESVSYFACARSGHFCYRFLSAAVLALDPVATRRFDDGINRYGW